MDDKDNRQLHKAFGYILDTGDASPILSLSFKNKQDAMCALANWAKFTGRYDRFLDIKKRYNLKWSREDPIHHF